MNEEYFKILKQVTLLMVKNIEDGTKTGYEYSKDLIEYSDSLMKMRDMMPPERYDRYRDFFDLFILLCKQCSDVCFFENNRINVADSLKVICECVDEVLFDFEEVQEEIDSSFCEDGPLVSVLMSAYNHDKYVAQAIESVINQSYKNIEFLVADDFSNDNTAMVMQRYEQFFTKSLYFNENVGSRLKDLRKYASGKYIAIMNSDDVWEKDKLYYQVKYLENHPEVGICFTWCKYVDENMNEIPGDVFFQHNKSRAKWLRYFWENGNCLCNPSSLARREFRYRIQRNGKECRQLPDFFNWVGLVQVTDFYIIPKTLVRMRRHENNKTENVSAESKTNTIRHCIEEGIHWMWAILYMDNEVFAEAFSEKFINKEAKTDQEICCEKYFFLLHSDNIFIQNGALTYLAYVYPDIENCLKEKYSYTLPDIGKEYINSGFGKVLSLQNSEEKGKY